MWSQRDLSLKGKITILKSLALPQLIYVTNVIYVPDSFIQKIDKDMVNFLWSGKPSKIKQDTIIADIRSGGLKMPHFHTMIKSQKIMWIKRLLDDKMNKWKILAWNLLGISKTELLSKLSLNFITNKVRSLFYRQLIDIWYSFYSVEPLLSEVQDEKLWNNRFIIINKKTVLYKTWMDHDILILHDLYDTNTEIMSIEQMSQKYCFHVDTMSYNSLLQAVPKKWKQSMSTNKPRREAKRPDTLVIIDNNKLCLESINSQMVYWHFINKIKKAPTAIDAWISEFIFLNDSDFGNYFEMPYKIVRDTKMQTFQYKILHNLIPCRAKLYIWKISDNSNCAACGEHDSQNHFFFDCPVSKVFLEHVSRWISNNIDIQMPLSKVDVLFGIVSNNQPTFYLNFILLYAKYYIYNCKRNEKTLFLFDFLIELKNAIELEKYIMVKNGELDKFNAKWNILYEALFSMFCTIIDVTILIY